MAIYPLVELSVEYKYVGLGNSTHRFETEPVICKAVFTENRLLLISNLVMEIPSVVGLRTEVIRAKMGLCLKPTMDSNGNPFEGDNVVASQFIMHFDLPVDFHKWNPIVSPVEGKTLVEFSTARPLCLFEHDEDSWGLLTVGEKDEEDTKPSDVDWEDPT